MKRYPRIVFILSLALVSLLVAIPGVCAQSATNEYRVKAGDTLEVTVAGEPNYSGVYQINADGNVLIPVVGCSVLVAGKTVDESRAVLAKTLSEYLINPIVLVRVSKFRVPVSGDVEKPGSYEMVPGETVMDAVTRAGGQRKDAPVVALQLKRNGAVTSLSPEGTGDTSFGVMLQPGDEVIATRGAVSEVAFKVSGMMEHPGTFALPAGQSVRISDAMRPDRAGRWTPEANPQKAQLIRKDGTKIPVDLTVLGQEAGSTQDFEIGPGDELFVPRMGMKISVLGGVRQPGEYPAPEGTTFLAAVTMAGGPSPTAMMKRCAIVRMKPDLTRVEINLDKIIRKADSKENQVLQDGDIVWVQDKMPPDTSQPWYQRVLGFLPWLLRF